VNNIKKSISNIEKEFKNNPLNFFTEADVVSKFYLILKQNLNSKTIKVEDEKWHRNEYLKRISDIDKMDHIHTEVPLLIDDDEIGNRRLDVGIFNDKNVVNYKLKNGSKKFYPKDFSTAIEIKFIKNTPNLTKKLKVRFEKDIKKLNRFEKETKKHLLIFSNKNIFERDEAKDWLHNKRNHYDEIKIRDIHL